MLIVTQVTEDTENALFRFVKIKHSNFCQKKLVTQVTEMINLLSKLKLIGISILNLFGFSDFLPPKY